MTSTQAKRASVAARAAQLRQTLAHSREVTDELMGLFDAFEERTAALEGVLLPIQGRIQTLHHAQTNIETTIEHCESMLAMFDISRKLETTLLQGPRGDAAAYLEALAELETAVSFLEGHQGSKSVESALKHAHGLRSKALQKCEDKLHDVLARHACQAEATLAPLQRAAPALPAAYEAAALRGGAGGALPSGGGAAMAGGAGLPLQLMADADAELLRTLSSCLLLAKRHGCLKIYAEFRLEFLEQALKAAGLDAKWDAEKASWEAIGKFSKQWIQCLHVVVKLVEAERVLVQRIFPRGHGEGLLATLAAPTLATLTRCGTSMLRNPVRDTEKVFVLLDIECHLSWALPELRASLAGPGPASPSAALMAQVDALQAALKAAARETFAAFEHEVRTDTVKHVVTDGTVHPLTSYVVYYVNRLLELHERVRLDALFSDPESSSSTTNNTTAAAAGSRRAEDRSGAGAGASAGGGGGGWMAGVAIMRIMLNLQTNLESKAAKYRDAALAHVFMMNNTHYLAQSVRRSRAMFALLGEDWTRRQEQVVTQCSRDYGDASFARLLELLDTAGATPAELAAAGGALDSKARQEVKDRFTKFNARFEQLHAEQSQYAIPDSHLRARLRDSIRRTLVPAYQAFVECHMQSQFSKTPQKYIKYSAEQVDHMLQVLFENKASAAIQAPKDGATSWLTLSGLHNSK